MMTTESLYNYFLTCTEVCIDTRKISKDCLFFCLKGPNFDGHDFAEKALILGAKYVVVDNKKFQNNSQMLLVEDVLAALQNLATFHRNQLGTKIIALTGSNGKTTTKELISAVLAQKYQVLATLGNLNNHIGVPLTLLRLTKETQIGIIEMGANHQREIAQLSTIAQPNFGYITNFGKAHLEGFGGVEGVINGKSELFDYLIPNNQLIFINQDDPIQVAKTREANRFSFGQSAEADVLLESVSENQFLEITVNNQVIKTQLTGVYNANNVMAAVSMGVYFEVPFDLIVKGIAGYSPNNHRSQLIEKNSNQIILDCYNANPSSMQVAIEHLIKSDAKQKIAILADMYELGEDTFAEHQTIVNLLKSQHIKAYFVGDYFYEHQQADKNFVFCKSFEDFKNIFKAELPQNSLILIKGSRAMALERTLEIL